MYGLAMATTVESTPTMMTPNATVTRVHLGLARAPVELPGATQPFELLHRFRVLHLARHQRGRVPDRGEWFRVPVPPSVSISARAFGLPGRFPSPQGGGGEAQSLPRELGDTTQCVSSPILDRAVDRHFDDK